MVGQALLTQSCTNLWGPETVPWPGPQSTLRLHDGEAVTFLGGRMSLETNCSLLTSRQ